MENSGTFKPVIQLFQDFCKVPSIRQCHGRGYLQQGDEDEGAFGHARMRQYQMGIALAFLIAEEEKIHVDDTGAETVVGIAHTAHLQLLGQHGVKQGSRVHAVVAVQSQYLIQKPRLILAALRLGTVDRRGRPYGNTGEGGQFGTGAGKTGFGIAQIGAEADIGVGHVLSFRYAATIAEKKDEGQSCTLFLRMPAPAFVRFKARSLFYRTLFPFFQPSVLPAAHAPWYRTIMKSAFYHILFGLAAAVLSCQVSGCGLLRQASGPAASKAAPLFESEPVRYDVEIRVEDLPAGQSASAVRSAMEANSQLVQLKEKLPDGILGLTRRAHMDQANAVKLLHSLGYYDGRASSTVIEPSQEGGRAQAILTLFAGPLYTLGSVTLKYSPAPMALPEFNGQSMEVPTTLASLKPGQPAKASDVLSAVDALPGELHLLGYPEARIGATRYTLDRPARALNVEVTADPGPAALMGDAVISGNADVSSEYLKKLTTWQQGRPWSSRNVERYRERLQQTGLFRTVDVKPAPMSEAVVTKEGGPVELPVQVEVQESSFRTIGASTRYSTDVGFGVQAEWQHRNLFGAGESLTVKAPFAQDKRGIQADFEKPCFGHRAQKLLAGASHLEEETDAYDTKAQNAYIGLERRLSRNWWARVKLLGETGTVTREDDEDYRYLSAMFHVRRDTRNSYVNPTSGTRVELELAPTGGSYGGSFSGVSSRLTASAYWSPFGVDWLVLAGRYSVGSFFGVDLANIPPTLRFYCGGGGSVRGYAYQAIGPKDRYGDPMGGRSFQDVNFEMRFRVSESIGIVPFVDGGMVYSDEYPELFSDFQWAAGLGLRYYTPIGPIRLDVAVPLDKKDDDSDYQFYISIGQAF